MSWGLWSRKQVEPALAAASLIGLDLDARRARAVHGPAGEVTPRPLKLDPPDDELVLAVSLEQRAPQVGRAALGLIRRLPHLTARAFLAALGQPREWRAGKLRIDATGATTLAAERIRAAAAGSPAVSVAVPAYLTPQQVSILTAALEHVRLSVQGTIVGPLAVAAVAPDRFRTALVADTDDHAFTWTVLTSDGEKARIAATLTLPHLSARVWMDRLLDATADRCVRVCRRDPRDSSAAEQYLFEQLQVALDRPVNQSVPLTIRTAHWYQELTLGPDDLPAFGALLARKATDGLRAVLEEAQSAVKTLDEPDLIWLTHGAARLPGLRPTLDAIGGDATVCVLPPDAVAVAAFALAGHWRCGELPRGHLDAVVPRFGLTLTNGTPTPKPASDADGAGHPSPMVRIREMLRRPPSS